MRKTATKIKRFAPQVFEVETAYHFPTLTQAPEMAALVWEIQCALTEGAQPVLCEMGTSAVYELKDVEGVTLAIFKAQEKEGLREVAAYLLDHGRFAGVPPTVMANFSHPLFGGAKRGSCQLFLQDAKAAVLFEERAFTKLSAAAVRRIAALDMRILNGDRHTSNLLLRDNELIPIDHGGALPHVPSEVHFVWLEWEQAATRFTFEEKAYFAKLDPSSDRRLLIDGLGMAEGAADLMYAAAELLKIGVAHDLTARQIGMLFVRGEGAGSSAFERAREALPKSFEVPWGEFEAKVKQRMQEEVACVW